MERFPITMSRFSNLRKLDLSRVTCTSGPEPLIAPEVMLSWRLEELILTGFPVNEKTLDAICAYLASDMSQGLYRLQMDQCNLTGAHVALLMRSMCHTPGVARPLHLHVSANRLEKGNSDIVKAIEESLTPTHLTMRMVEYRTESRFRQLLQALRVNTTIKSLDISKASLPNDASDETCQALRSLFEENKTLEELDISGEHAHLEIARFGIGLSDALEGLKKNTSLKVLKIEYQNLSLQGANTLASVLMENDTLEHVWCEHNGISLQGFTVLINALAHNFNVLYLPPMKDDQTQAVRSLAASLSGVAPAQKDPGVMKHSVRKTLTTLGMKSQRDDPAYTSPQDVEQGIILLNSRWQAQSARLQNFLDRNYRIAQGLETPQMYLDGDGEHMRPHTAVSDGDLMEQVITNRTPRVELGNPVDDLINGERGLTSLDLDYDEKVESLGAIDIPQPKGWGEDVAMVIGSMDSGGDFAHSAAIGRAFELGGHSASPSDTEASSLKS